MLGKNKSIFVDLDGTIVIHNYNPEEIEDIFIPDVVEYLKEEIKSGSILILTTARPPEHCIKIIEKLKSLGITFEHCVFNLSTGKRILINDKKQIDGEDKALAINVLRNKGFGYNRDIK